jgi:hypothetical protein
VVESLGDVFVEEPEIGCPVVDKEWACDCAVLREDESHEGRGVISGSLLTAFHISSSRFKIPVPRKVSLTSLHCIVVREGWGALTTALSGYRHERSLCGQSPA